MVAAATPTATDEELVMRVRGGDGCARSAMLLRYHANIVRVVRRFRVDECDRDDFVQDALLTVAEKMHLYEGRAQFSTWLYRVVCNTVLMRLRSNMRKKNRALRGSEDVEDETVAVASPGLLQDALLARARDLALVGEVLDAMEEPMREAFEAYYGEDRALEDIAASVGTSEPAIRSRVHRAREKVRAAFRTREAA